MRPPISITTKVYNVIYKERKINFLHIAKKKKKKKYTYIIEYEISIFTFTNPFYMATSVVLQKQRTKSIQQNKIKEK